MSFADLGWRHRGEAMGSGSGPAASRWIGGRRRRGGAATGSSRRRHGASGGSERWCRRGDVGGGGSVEASTRMAVGARWTEATSRQRRGRRERRRRPPSCSAVFPLFPLNFPFLPHFFSFQFPSTFSSYAAERVLHLVSITESAYAQSGWVVHLFSLYC